MARKSISSIVRLFHKRSHPKYNALYLTTFSCALHKTNLNLKKTNLLLLCPSNDIFSNNYNNFQS